MREAVGWARERLLQRHIRALFAESPGEPAEAIASTAERLAADLVVVGGATGPDSTQEPGSVLAGVLRQAACDVLVVR
jgi:nucleotide-binding universal stress UspA family protein